MGGEEKAGRASKAKWETPADPLPSHTRDATSVPAYEDLLKIVGVMLVAIDHRENIIFINAKACEVLECREEEALGGNWFDLFIPERRREPVRAVFQQLMRGEIEPAERFENEVVSRKGHERIIAWNNTALRDADGSIHATLSSGEDITAQRKAEVALSESEKRFRLFMDYLPALAFIKDHQSRLVYANRTMQERLGFREAPGNDPTELPSSPAAANALATDEIARSSGMWIGEEELSTETGERRLYETIKFRIPGQGERHLLGGIALDITDKRRSEKKSEVHSRDLALVAESAVGLVEFPADGDLYAYIADKLSGIVPPGSVIAVSAFKETEDVFVPTAITGLRGNLEGVERLLDYDLHELKVDLSPEAREALATGRLTKVSGGLTGLSPGTLTNAVIEKIERLFGGGDVYVVGFAREGRVHGGVCILVKSDAPLFDARTIEASVGQVSVALERRRSQDKLRETEEQLHQSQKLEAIGVLAGGVAHDFNNMLSAILGYSEVALATLRPGDPTFSDVTCIIEAAERAASLTRQLLAFSRKQPMEPRIVDVNSTMEALERMLRRILGEDIVVELRLNPELSRVRVDPGQLDQVIMNLAVNARDAMPEGGRLTIETSEVELDGDYLMRHPHVSAGRFVMMAISDTGHGMNAATLGRVFEPFFTTKERGRGTGLGLSTV